MANIHSVKKLYWHVLEYPVKPKNFFEKADTQLIDPPYSYGSGVAIRAPFSKKALVIGLWWGTLHETQALTRAIGGKILPIDDSEFWDKIRFGE